MIWITRGAADALREHGVWVPDDVALVGFDNWEIIATKTRPPLTTVDLNLHDLGCLAGTKMLEMIDGSTTSGVIRVPCSLIVRESSGSPRPEQEHQMSGEI